MSSFACAREGESRFAIRTLGPLSSARPKSVGPSDMSAGQMPIAGQTKLRRCRFDADEEAVALQAGCRRDCREDYRRSPLTTMSICQPPHCEHISRSRQSSTVVSAPCRSAISAGSGSTWWCSQCPPSSRGVESAAVDEGARLVTDALRLSPYQNRPPWGAICLGRPMPLRSIA